MPESAYPTNYPNNIAYRRPNRIREEASTRGPRRRVVRQHKEPFQPAVDDLLATARRAHTPERALIKADTHPDSPSSRVFGARQPRRTTSREKEKLVFLSSSSPKEASVITIRLRRLFFQAFFFFFLLTADEFEFRNYDCNYRRNRFRRRKASFRAINSIQLRGGGLNGVK